MNDRESVPDSEDSTPAVLKRGQKQVLTSCEAKIDVNRFQGDTAQEFQLYISSKSDIDLRTYVRRSDEERLRGLSEPCRALCAYLRMIEPRVTE